MSNSNDRVISEAETYLKFAQFKNVTGLQEASSMLSDLNRLYSKLQYESGVKEEQLDACAKAAKVRNLLQRVKKWRDQIDQELRKTSSGRVKLSREGNMITINNGMGTVTTLNKNFAARMYPDLAKQNPAFFKGGKRKTRKARKSKKQTRRRR